MRSDVDRFGVPILLWDVGADPVGSATGKAVVVFDPSFALPSMPCLFPSCELAKGVVVAGMTCLAAHSPRVGVRPASDDGVDRTPDCLLRGSFSCASQQFHWERVAFDGFSPWGDAGFEPKGFSWRVLSGMGFSPWKWT